MHVNKADYVTNVTISEAKEPTYKMKVKDAKTIFNSLEFRSILLSLAIGFYWSPSTAY